MAFSRMIDKIQKCVIAMAGCSFQPEAISFMARGLLRPTKNVGLAMTHCFLEKTIGDLGFRISGYEGPTFIYKRNSDMGSS